ncbi:MAG TPA: ABC transporter ATP-binding protein [Acidimicrobiales bacterium]|nr:ABC transporter ATP-binding protein [Acidimicrobiales bacterium]
MTKHPVVEVRDLVKSYDGRSIVDHVDLDVFEGEIVGLLGANGAGKTTTVECIEGLRRPDSGHVRVLGIDAVRNPAAVRPLIGSQLQDSALPDRLRVEEAVSLFARPPVRHADALLTAFGLAEQRRQPFAVLSGGQRQRLFLVLALLNRPKLVVLDELTQGLDPAARQNVWDAIHALREAGTTVLLVTHYMDEAEVLCDRVAVMQAGRIVASGAPAELVDRYARWATVRFTSTGPAAVASDALSVLPGVRTVQYDGATVEVHGDRTMIAQVGAWLVAHGDVPDDLWVGVPDLEDAVIELLEPRSDVELLGGVR